MNEPVSFQTSDPILEFRLTQAEKHMAKQDEEMTKLEEEIRANRVFYETKMQEMKDAYDKQERSRLMWGISSLGSLVMLMGGVLWTYRGVIFKGTQ